MDKRFLYAILSFAVFFGSCGGSSTGDKTVQNESSTAAAQEASAPAAAADDKGIGKFKDVQLTHPLDEGMLAKGTQIFDVKCSSCHKLTDEKLVGPGWKGVTDRRTPEWIMNFVTNVDEMLDKDPEAKAMLELCMVRMPNQNLSDDDARAILEYMRKNDNKK
ncbi:c-type cytochrome [Pararcticibacter amylolyticus]|uniref:Cytochrome C n=1 Tax=Pararcticibacter amylolyticus TaxID=2173175 RepID=A0A2U2PIB1_9SPHI|nr:cytochrome c [Pararcticibacter amylolyticus]PWG81143.1 cytochrome C [Pararcticibacter amylolyticus]